MAAHAEAIILRARLARDGLRGPVGCWRGLPSSPPMRAFDLAGADRKPFGQGLSIFELVHAIAEIAMACANRRVFVARFERFAVRSEGSQNLVQAPRLQRLFRIAIQASRVAGVAEIAFPASLRYSQT